MKLIDAIIIASQEYGIYDNWTILNQSYGRVNRLGNMVEGVYSAYTTSLDLIAEHERLEATLASLAEYDAAAIVDEGWQVSYFEMPGQEDKPEGEQS